MPDRDGPMDLLIALRDVGLPPQALDAAQASVDAALARERHRERSARARRSHRAFRPGMLATAFSAIVAVVVALGAVALLSHRPPPAHPAGRRTATHRALPGDEALITAGVYDRDPQRFDETISVDKGADDGVQTGDPAIADRGLVGQVTTVDPTVSVVTLITNPSFEVSAQVQNANGDRGTLVAETGDPQRLLLEYLGADATVAPGQLVVTTGSHGGPLRSFYPPGIPIGTISAGGRNPLVDDGSAHVTPLVDLRRLSTVQILTQLGQTGRS